MPKKLLKKLYAIVAIMIGLSNLNKFMVQHKHSTLKISNLVIHYFLFILSFVNQLVEVTQATLTFLNLGLYRMLYL
jgi:hypothetical protein